MTKLDLQLAYKRDTGEEVPNENNYFPFQLEYVHWLERKLLMLIKDVPVKLGDITDEELYNAIRKDHWK